MFTLLTRGQRIVVVLIWVVFFGNLLLAMCNWSREDSYHGNDNHTIQVDPTSVSDTHPAEQMDRPGKTTPASHDSKLFRVEINTASAEEFQHLPGIGPALAKAIVAWREESGPFLNIEDIKLVPGIGPKKFDSLKTFIFVERKRPIESTQTSRSLPMEQ